MVTTERHPVSVVLTVKDEAASLPGLLDSLLAQTRPPDEVVVVDGGSRDGTVAILNAYASRGLPLRTIVVPGCNISEGRNAAIAAAAHDLIAVTDGGVRLVPGWLEALTVPFAGAARPDVVSGFFLSDPRTAFEVAMGATVLPALAEIDRERFLPSSRSVAFTREAWRRAGRYPEWLDYCEDLVFDLRLREEGCRFAFVPEAIAFFRPRPTVRAFFKQYYRYARGDGKADLWRKRHAVRYATYLLGPVAFLAGFWYKGVWLPLGLAMGAYLYRPYRRLLPSLRGMDARQVVQVVLCVPVIRLVGDVAKMAGYPVGVWWRLRHGGGPVTERGEDRYSSG